MYTQLRFHERLQTINRNMWLLKARLLVGGSISWSKSEKAEAMQSRAASPTSGCEVDSERVKDCGVRVVCRFRPKRKEHASEQSCVTFTGDTSLQVTTDTLGGYRK